MVEPGVGVDECAERVVVVIVVIMGGAGVVIVVVSGGAGVAVAADKPDSSSSSLYNDYQLKNRGKGRGHSHQTLQDCLPDHQKGRSRRSNLSKRVHGLSSLDNGRGINAKHSRQQSDGLFWKKGELMIL